MKSRFEFSTEKQITILTFRYTFQLLQTLSKVPLMQDYGNRHTCGNFHPFKRLHDRQCVVKPLLISKSDQKSVLLAGTTYVFVICQVYEYKLQCLQSIFSYCKPTPTNNMLVLGRGGGAEKGTELKVFSTPRV